MQVLGQPSVINNKLEKWVVCAEGEKARDVGVAT